jgi:hypothetical protein
MNFKLKKLDNFFIGFVPAVILPFALILLISSKGQWEDYTLYEHFVQAFNSFLFFKIAIMALMPNLVFFFFAYKLELWKLNSGLISATLSFLAFVFLVS